VRIWKKALCAVAIAAVALGGALSGCGNEEIAPGDGVEEGAVRGDALEETKTVLAEGGDVRETSDKLRSELEAAGTYIHTAKPQEGDETENSTESDLGDLDGGPGEEDGGEESDKVMGESDWLAAVVALDAEAEVATCRKLISDSVRVNERDGEIVSTWWRGTCGLVACSGTITGYTDLREAANETGLCHSGDQSVAFGGTL